MANERRAAKEAYLAALQQQVTAEEVTNYQTKSDARNIPQPKAVSDRERALDEKRDNFLRKQDKNNNLIILH